MGFLNSFFSGFNGGSKENHVSNSSVNNEANSEPKAQAQVDNVEKEVTATETVQATQSQEKQPRNKSGKAQIYNLIIVDESGSMMSLRDVTISGINETIGTIRAAQAEFADKQDHYLTLVTFRDGRGRGRSVRTIIDSMPIDSVRDFKDYYPQGCTPLYDAMGESLTSLHEKIASDEDATGVVTVLTDGLENSSKEWNSASLRRLIEQLKEEGWTFSYMGSAHDVKSVTDLLSIDNVMEFSHDMTGASNTWARDRSSKRSYYSKMAVEFNADDSWEEKKSKRRRYNDEYYGDRYTPDVITSLEPNDIFVFGSNAEGHHDGGAALTAVRLFGAVYGCGEGIQGQSYAIPTTGGFELLRAAIHRFCVYAREHRDKRFLVTRIACGNAGYSANDIAPLFREAIELENVTMPKDFWSEQGLKFTTLL